MTQVLTLSREGYSSWQVLMQMAVNSIQEFDGMTREATILWLHYIKAIAKKMGIDPIEIGMSKLKGMALCNVNTISKEGHLSYFQFHQLLIEHYSNIPYTSDTLSGYAHLMQGKNESVTQYLVGPKYSWSIFTIILNVWYSRNWLWQAIPYSRVYWPPVWRRVASKQDTWWSMEDVFQTINHVTSSSSRTGLSLNLILKQCNQLYR